MEDRKRLNSTENNGFMSMCAALNAISDAEVLEKRIRTIPHAWGMYKSCAKQIEKLIEMICGTVPVEQLMAWHRNRKTLKYYIAVTSPMGRPYDNDGRWLSYDALDTILDAAQAYCLTCTKNPQEQRQCKLAKAMDELPLRKADERAHGCRYFTGLF